MKTKLFRETVCSNYAKLNVMHDMFLYKCIKFVVSYFYFRLLSDCLQSNLLPFIVCQRYLEQARTCYKLASAEKIMRDYYACLLHRI